MLLSKFLYLKDNNILKSKIHNSHSNGTRKSDHKFYDLNYKKMKEEQVTENLIISS